MSKSGFHTAFLDTLPVLTGYLVLGMGFGVIMHANGYGIWYALAMSVFIYAGSMQYAAIGLFTGGASLLTTALTTLAVNARHLFYGISMLGEYRGSGAWKPYLIFSLTDETYSLVCSGGKSRSYQIMVSLLDHIYWVSGTLLGALLGGILPINTKGIDFALTALFLTVFTEQWCSSKNHFSALTGVLVSVISLILFGSERFLIPAMAGITAVLLLKREVEKRHER